MASRADPFVPFSLRVLLGRIDREWTTRRRIFDLPPNRFYDASAGPDLATEFLGRPAGTPIGPAAGPHTQLAQNIVLAWLGGARTVELKTVQVLDELDVARPCIDMQTVGYNVEWSQELRIGQSLEEYAKAWMIIEILRGWPELRPFLGPDPGPLVFDTSVGYDLAGISSAPVAAFLDGLVDAGSTIERLRAEIPQPFAAWRDHAFPPRISDSVTLSTFHGCPADEIGAIAKHLMTRHGLDVVVKLNPTLLGYERVHEIVVEELGYDEIRLSRAAFDADLSFARALELIGDLDAFAAAHGRRFGIKLTNTLVVENHRGFLSGDPMYLSGPPLHVLAISLLAELDRALPGMLRVGREDGRVQVSYSAGVTKHNLAKVAGLGLSPITMTSDLLKPGGYGRLKPMLTALSAEMTAAGCDDLPAWRAHEREAAAASGYGSPVEAYAAALHDPARNEAYTRTGTAKLPREVDAVLQPWDCVSCNLCVTVCPNDAFFRLPVPETVAPGGGQQYLLFAELCNECGNCMVFCPEAGDPAKVKPALFLDPDRFARGDRPGFLLTHDDGHVRVTASPGLEADVDRLVLLLDQHEGLPLDPAGLVPSGARTGS